MKLDGRTALLFVDGRDSGDLPEGSTVSCTADEHPARLVRFADRDFHQILKNKFGLPGPDTDRRWIIDGIDGDAFGFSDADDEAVERARSTRSPDAG